MGFVFCEEMYAVINQAAFFMRSILSFGVIMSSTVLYLGCGTQEKKVADLGTFDGLVLNFPMFIYL